MSTSPTNDIVVDKAGLTLLGFLGEMGGIIVRRNAAATHLQPTRGFNRRVIISMIITVVHVEGAGVTLHDAHGGLDGGGGVADGGVQLLAAGLGLQARLHALHLSQLRPQPRSHRRQQPLQPSTATGFLFLHICRCNACD